MLGFEEDSPDKEKSIIHYSFCTGDERHTGNQAQFMVDLEKKTWSTDENKTEG